MNLIVAADKNWGIGIKGKLLASFPEDMQMFRDTTTGGVVIMGRKTLESLPGGKGLRDRRNIVLTENKNYKAKDAEVCHSVEEALELVKDEDPDRVFCIGGGKIYRLFLPHCKKAYITKIDYAYDADTYFPNLDESDEWKVVGTSDEMSAFDVTFRFLLYGRVK